MPIVGWGLAVAFPRGRRGLKLGLTCAFFAQVSSRLPSRKAWIETFNTYFDARTLRVAFPRGRRGLKLQTTAGILTRMVSPSLAEGVD